MSTPNTIRVNRSRIRCSANAFTMIVVLEMAMIAPAYTLSMTDQPKSRPTRKPVATMALVWRMAITDAVGPTANRFRRLNSSPSANMSRMTPSSERIRTIPSSATSGIGTWGPRIMPATR
jgi:hypothetical protein